MILSMLLQNLEKLGYVLSVEEAKILMPIKKCLPKNRIDKPYVDLEIQLANIEKIAEKELAVEEDSKSALSERKPEEKPTTTPANSASSSQISVNLFKIVGSKEVKKESDPISAVNVRALV